MSCSKQHSPAAFLKLIKTSTGVDISQSEWHEIKKLAKDAGYDVSRTRSSPDDVDFTLSDLQHSFRSGQTLECSKLDLNNAEQEAKEALFDSNGSLRNSTTRGTIGTIGYMVTSGRTVSGVVQEIRDRKASLKATVSEEVALAIASNPFVAELNTLSYDTNAGVREAVATNYRTPLDTLFELTNDRDMAVASAANSNIVTNHFWAAIQNGSTPASVLDSLAATKDDFTRQEVARHPNTDCVTLEYLANSTHMETRARVAANPNTPPETLDKLARGDSQYIVAMNPSASEETLTFIADNAEDDHVKVVALKNLGAREPRDSGF